MILVCGTVSLIAFPLDDIWHRIFGQDVTLWGPTHLLLFGGASFAILGVWVLQIEAARARGKDVPTNNFIQKFRDISLAGALLIGLSTFQGEFDFAVPQFRLVWHPILLAIAAGIALVAARIRLGRGGAVMAALFFIALRGLLTLLVGPVLGEIEPHFPLYLAEALCVELVALRWDQRRPITMGAIAGVLIGTVGFFAEYGWSHVWMVNPWPESLIAEALPVTLVAAIGAGILGGAIGRAVTPEASVEQAPGWIVALGGAAVIAACIWAVPEPVPSNPPQATVTLDETRSGSQREAYVTAKLDPPDAAKDAHWLNVTAWQGGTPAIVSQLEETGPGTYRSEEPIPLHGDWKSTLRLQRDDQVLGLPIFLPADEAIPVEETPAPAQFTREFQDDKKLLLREQKGDVSPVLTTIAYGAVLLIAVIVAVLLVLGLRRIRTRLEDDDGAPPSRPAEQKPSTRVAAAH
jgi:hypothetical protein